VFRYLLKPPKADEVRGALHAAARIVHLERSHEYMLAELRRLNRELEARVRQRTRELEEANRELERRSQLLERVALTDGLTQLPNRRAVQHFAESELHRRRRVPAPLAVALIDVDHFKAINSQVFHTGGDRVLAEVARRMAGALRTIDMLGRVGGDEFMLIAPQTSRAGALTLAERLRALVQDRPFDYDGQPIPVTVTIGLAVLEAGRAADCDQIHQAVREGLRRGADDDQVRQSVLEAERAADYQRVKAAAAAALARAKANGRTASRSRP
jgi:diguanylate cyclase (GGDEF)-like protein